MTICFVWMGFDWLPVAEWSRVGVVVVVVWGVGLSRCPVPQGSMSPLIGSSNLALRELNPKSGKADDRIHFAVHSDCLCMRLCETSFQR